MFVIPSLKSVIEKTKTKTKTKTNAKTKTMKNVGNLEPLLMSHSAPIPVPERGRCWDLRDMRNRSTRDVRTRSTRDYED